MSRLQKHIVPAHSVPIRAYSTCASCESAASIFSMGGSFPYSLTTAASVTLASFFSS